MLKTGKGPRMDGPPSGALENRQVLKGGDVMCGLIAVLLILTLLGCAAPPEAEAPDASVSAARSERPERESMRASMVEESARTLMEAEILAAYERAQQLYGWFDLAPLPTSDETAVWERETYHRVDLEGVETLEDLRTCLRSVFSRELTDRLLNGEAGRIRYRDIGGALCVSGIPREPDSGKRPSRVEAEQLEETVYSVNVLVDLMDEDREAVVGVESWSFPYVFEEDRWVFTEFCLVY